MSEVAEVLAFERITDEDGRASDVKADLGGRAINVTHFADPGDDSQPLSSDYVALSSAPGAGAEQAVGYLDPNTPPAAGPGEKRIYSRSGPGVVAAVVWLKSDGTVVIENASGGAIQMAPSGDVTINGVTIDAAGNISTPGDVIAKTLATPVSLSTHVHTSTAPGSATSGPLPAPPPP